VNNPHFASDQQHMAEALALARLGLASTDPNPRVGCVIVREGRVVGTGYHRRAGEAHAEVHALREAGDLARGATAYVTLEPCSHHGRTPPCADALIAAGIARVVVAMKDPCDKVAGAGLHRLREHGIEVTEGVLREQAEELSQGFFHRMRTGKPWLRLKLAQSLDGRSAMASGESQWITGPAARANAQLWRARSAAIVTGIGTVLADDCRLTVRPDQLPEAVPFDEHRDQPLRIVLDSRLRMPLTAAMLRAPGHTVVLTAAETASRQKWQEKLLKTQPELATKVRIEAVPAASDGRLDLTAVRDWLGELSMNEVLIEAGATLAGAWLKAELVDELLVYTAPVLLGSSARPSVLLPLQHMADKLTLEVRQRQLLGQDELLRAQVRKKAQCDQTQTPAHGRPEQSHEGPDNTLYTGEAFGHASAVNQASSESTTGVVSEPTDEIPNNPASKEAQ